MTDEAESDVSADRWQQNPGSEALLAPTATVEQGASVGKGTRVWDLAQIRTGATIGSGCVIGRSAFVDAGVTIGHRCKIQNNALVYSPAVISDGVFIGPAAVLTNDRFPRAVTPNGDVKSASDWEPSGVQIEHGASVGAGAIVIGGVRVGAWALVAAGAVVTSDVEAHALVAGVPAHRIGWVGRAGLPLRGHDGVLRCPTTGEAFSEIDGRLETR